MECTPSPEGQAAERTKPKNILRLVIVGAES